MKKVQINLKINFSTRSVGERIQKRGKENFFYKPQEVAIKEIEEEKEFVEERIKNAAEYHKKMIDEEKSGKRLEIDKSELHKV